LCRCTLLDAYVLSYVLVGFTVLVVAGLVFEYRPDFREWFTGRPRDRRDPWPVRIGAVLVILGVAGEVGFTFWSFKVESDLKTISSNIEGVLKKEIALLGASATEAAKEADHAKELAEQANVESGKAKDKAGDALSSARGARQEADSFEKDIVSAKTQAADAESHLADALQRAAAATAELDRIKTPRSLTNIPKLISTLAEFKDTEYTFSSVGADPEPLALLKSVDDLLQHSGWKRGKAIPGFPTINVFGKDVQYSVPVALTDGVRISVDSPEGLEPLKQLPLEKLPTYVRAAISLYLSLSSNLFPADEHAQPVDVQKGESRTVRISIGKKP
jgi:hypothetical protein